MFALPGIRLGMLAAGLSCLMLGTAWSQVRDRENKLESTAQGRDADSDRGEIVPLNRAPTLQGQPHTAQFRGTQSVDQAQPVQKFLAACLLQRNKAEVELGQLAQKQAQNSQVKQFAQTMVQDHQQAVQKLQPLAGMQGGRTGASGQLDAQAQTADTRRVSGSAGTGQTIRDDSQNLSSNQASGQQNAAIRELAQIEQQITDRYFESVREELQQKQGVEFDRCYIGTQVAGHMHMLAALQVIEQQGPDQLRQIAQDTRPKVEQHLQQAKQLMKQLESSSQAERQPLRTQR